MDLLQTLEYALRPFPVGLNPAPRCSKSFLKGEAILIDGQRTGRFCGYRNAIKKKTTKSEAVFWLDEESASDD